jgi:hypothetical protein
MVEPYCYHTATINGGKTTMTLIKRVLPSGCRAATLAEHRLKKQALGITKKLRGRRTPTPTKGDGASFLIYKPNGEIFE